MSMALKQPAFVRRESAAAMPAPASRRASLVQIFFGDLLSAGLTIMTGAMLIALVPKFIDWAVISGVFSGDGTACRDGGACWAFLREKYRQILFGIYPSGEHWRPALMIGIILVLTLWSLFPRNWTRQASLFWLVGLAVVFVLMRGGVFGLVEVPTTAWGGLPVTLLLTIASLGLGFPLAVALALGRRSEMRIVSIVSVGVIETIRGLPLLSLLFIASILLPIMLPDGVSIDKLFRALVALTVFSAAYLAEVLRGGLQALPNGQAEAARALGLSWWQAIRLIVLPQAIRKVIPPLTNTIIVMVKNTSLVLVVGLFDLLSSGRAATTDPAWPSPYVETYLFVAAIYFVICFSISRYSRWLEARLALEAAR